MCGITRDTSIPLTVENEVDTTMEDDDISTDSEGVDDTEILRNDVVAGRGNGVQSLPGNQNYRQHIAKYKGIYLSSPNHQKTKIAEDIIGRIKALDPPGRFLRSSDRGFVEMSQKKALEKVMQALRDSKTNHGGAVEDRNTMLNARFGVLFGSVDQQVDYPYGARKVERQLMGPEYSGMSYREHDAFDRMADSMGAAATAIATADLLMSPHAMKYEQYEHLSVDPLHGMKLLTDRVTQELDLARLTAYATGPVGVDVDDMGQYVYEQPNDYIDLPDTAHRTQSDTCYMLMDQFSDSLDDDTDPTVSVFHLCRRAGLL